MSKTSSFKLGSSLMAVAIVFSIFPLGGTDNAKPTQINKSKIIFNQADPFLLSLPESKISVEIGVSNYDIARQPKLVKSQAVKYPDAKAHLDPTEFRPVYMAAAKQFNIPWQLIEAVHQIESGKSGSTDKRSYAGATGPMQFMPGTWRGYAVDGNNDGSTDITDVTDAIYTGAHYLAKSGADEGRIDDALFNYNHSTAYVNKVKTIAYEIGLPKNN
jgi:soluble lytic murein transglycosylase-like protein